MPKPGAATSAYDRDARGPATRSDSSAERIPSRPATAARSGGRDGRAAAAERAALGGPATAAERAALGGPATAAESAALGGPATAAESEIAGRRTVTIRGRGAERYVPRRASEARRPRQPRHERAGFKPDRAALWAVLLGVLLILAAAASAHAATLHVLAHIAAP